MEKNVADRKAELAKSIANQAILMLADKNENYPDYAGQFYFITGESFLKALCENDGTLTGAIFHTYLAGCITRFEQLRPVAIVPATLEDDFRIATSVLLDLMELSGYAKLLAEFHQNPALWEGVENAWTNLIIGKAGDAVKKYLALTTHINNNGFGLPLRSELRFEWERQIFELFKQLPVEAVDKHFGMDTNYHFVHPSPLIRSIKTDHFDRLPSGYDLFLVTWYKDFVNPEGLDLNWKQEALLRAINKADNLPNSGEGG
ncbi:hypothetical protein [Pseudomonas multiresinivorans]|uniref:Uncharacterized protein n=1 Tax=Pseudomonas multiresinivorans TaxID=95301 RepID=A0A7Z3BMZ9_9PSED|nr:hypothetical protein [Pseudomonas multiresinivorans]QJP09352.1 hypothetical protein G4G71_16210 [Pseudomonas multiresinivorans]